MYDIINNIASYSKSTQPLKHNDIDSENYWSFESYTAIYDISNK